MLPVTHGALQVSPIQFPKIVNILIVEDDPIVRTLIGWIMEKEGYVVKFAFNGEEGLEELRKFQFSLVISDVEMPKMGGHEFITKMRADPRNSGIPVVVLTGRDDDRTELSFLELEISDFVKKGTNADVILARVRKALDSNN